MVTGCFAGAGRKQDLVEVGDPQLTVEDVPRPGGAEARPAAPVPPGLGVSGSSRLQGHRGLGGREIGTPQPIGVGFHLIVGPAAEAGTRVVLRVPPRDGVLVVLVQHQPLLLARLVGAGAHQHKPALELVAV